MAGASVLELTLLEATIVACHATAAVLDTWKPPQGYAARVAGDELWILGSRTERCELLRAVESSLRASAPGALVIDQTDGWAAWSLGGSSASHALARLTVMPLDPRGGALHQGAVAGIPAKVLITAGEHRVFVPSPVGHHLHDRVLEACADLAPKVGSTREFEVRPA